jgi:hypothetical protein
VDDSHHLKTEAERRAERRPFMGLPSAHVFAVGAWYDERERDDEIPAERTQPESAETR